VSDRSDALAMMVLEEAVAYATEQLERGGVCLPFGILLDSAEQRELLTPPHQDPKAGYEALEEAVCGQIATRDITVALLALDTPLPAHIAKDRPPSIRLHLEERSQIGKVVGARYLYIPYHLEPVGEGVQMRLQTPIPVGIRAAYIV